MKTAENSLKSCTLLDKPINYIASEIDKEIVKGLILRTIKIARTKGGTPCLWESYSEFDNLIRTTVIVDNEGKIKDSIFVRNQKNKQALIPIDENDCIIKVFKDTIGIAVSVLIIHEISAQRNEAVIYPTFRKESSEDKEFPSEYLEAITKCLEKLEDYDLIVSQINK